MSQYSSGLKKKREAVWSIHSDIVPEKLLKDTPKSRCSGGMKYILWTTKLSPHLLIHSIYSFSSSSVQDTNSPAHWLSSRWLKRPFHAVPCELEDTLCWAHCLHPALPLVPKRLLPLVGQNTDSTSGMVKGLETVPWDKLKELGSFSWWPENPLEMILDFTDLKDHHREGGVDILCMWSQEPELKTSSGRDRDIVKDDITDDCHWCHLSQRKDVLTVRSFQVWSRLYQ